MTRLPANCLTPRAMLRFAPMWMPVSKFPPDPNIESAVPSSSYAMIWHPEWQREVGLSAEQKQALSAIETKAIADARLRAEQFESLSPEEQQAKVKERAGKPAPTDDVRKQIEAVLTPRQLQTLKDYSFSEHAVGLLYDDGVWGIGRIDTARADAIDQYGDPASSSERFDGVGYYLDDDAPCIESL